MTSAQVAGAGRSAGGGVLGVLGAGQAAGSQGWGWIRGGMCRGGGSMLGATAMVAGLREPVYPAGL